MSSSKQHHNYKGLVPNYRGERWIPVRLPQKVRDWTYGGEKSIVTPGHDNEQLICVLEDLEHAKAWHWPKRQQFFFSDLHGDAEAFSASLVATGGIERRGKLPCDFSINSIGRRANFIIGGDCFDKGPSSLDLLRTVRQLKKRGARVRVLAGNHDIRLLFGMRAVGDDKDPRNEHFFIRTGRKVIPLLKEVWEHHVKGKAVFKNVPSEKECRRLLFPRKAWFDEFPKLTHDDANPEQLRRELTKISHKMDRFEHLCDDAGLSQRQVYAATQQWIAMFLKKEGEFHWFYKNMRLCYRAGSLLFIHAGVDDSIAKTIAGDGTGSLNRQFRRALYDAPLDYYYSSICNTIRTKYRDVDKIFSEKGTRNLRRAGITALVHGHRNLHNGQRISLRCSQLSFECDTSLDQHTRRVENVTGRGASVTIVEPQGYILGVSSDFANIKAFHPETTLGELKAASRK